MAFSEFPKSVPLYPGRALPGQPASGEQFVVPAFNCLSDGTLSPGCFAFASDEASDGGISYAGKTSKAAKPRLLGMVVRQMLGQVAVPFESASDTWARGTPAAIFMRGQVYAAVPEGQEAREGQAVLCDPASGEVSYGDAGAAHDTGWIVHLLPGGTSAAAGEIVLYERF